MDKTSRGKFEGGDAAWEETNLKSYARSEIRLVEIQEGLCSEVNNHQDSCYSLAEQAEQLLEMWWFKQAPDTADLYSWLCIDTLHYCCPKLHYGELCSPCPLDKDNKICGGRGKCHGEGTRKGNGTCICNKGYKGSNCEDCDKNFYRGSDTKCKACHKACEGCNGGGPNACYSCKSGWILEAVPVQVLASTSVLLALMIHFCGVECA
ncbi:Cysteine-rich with EGF-like domain protein 2 [Eumeta japonica]|uniref:Cysteine-rich with EGF-like domain protein 2 n=1 Tax=Eumeta variegata TaxID=151549 RepID=A0A4C1Y471_EUMVA|nr:Cysteine-rich with EGF-like domain protein 2 [Eumeta japonica]